MSRRSAKDSAECMPTLFPLHLQMPPGDIERYGPAAVRAGERPSGHEALVLDAAVRKLLPEVTRWLRRNGGSTRGVAKDLIEAARELERGCRWTCGPGLVELLDRLVGEARSVHRELVAVWVRVYGIRPALSPGDRVRFQAVENGEAVSAEGEVTGVDALQASYRVRRLAAVHAGGGADADPGEPGEGEVVLGCELVEAA